MHIDTVGLKSVAYFVQSNLRGLVRVRRCKSVGPRPAFHVIDLDEDVLYVRIRIHCREIWQGLPRRVEESPGGRRRLPYIEEPIAIGVLDRRAKHDRGP